MKKIHKRFQQQFLSELNSPDNHTRLKHVLGIKHKKSLHLKHYLFASISFVFALLIVITLLNQDLNPFTSGAPRYIGMDVSSSNNLNVSSKPSQSLRSPMRLGMMQLSSDTDPIQDYLDGLSIITRDDIIYYGKKNESVIITIYLDNPNQYEILSFTLNNRLYQSFEFLPQSNSNQLLISYDLSSTPGIASLTIDAIKYVVDTSIRNVIMSGEQTIRVGVSFDILPTLETYEIFTTKDSLSFTYEIIDSSALVSNTLQFILYNGFDVTSYPLSRLSDTFELFNLQVGFTYNFALISIFDPIDGLGRRVQVLLKDSFDTLHDLTISNVETTLDSISFDIDTTISNMTYTSTLYVDNLEIASSTLKNVMFDNLLSNTSYEIVISYTYIVSNIPYTTSRAYTYQTLNYDIPYIEMMSLISFNSILFSTFNVFDPFDLLSIISFDVYYENTLLQSIEPPFNLVASTTDPRFKEGSFQLAVSSKGLYKVVAIYRYNLNDGLGDIVINSTDPSLKHVLSLFID